MVFSCVAVCTAEESEAAYKKSAALDPTNVDSLFRLGAIAQSRGDKVAMHSINIQIANVDKDLAQQYSQMLGCDSEC